MNIIQANTENATTKMIERPQIMCHCNMCDQEILFIAA